VNWFTSDSEVNASKRVAWVIPQLRGYPLVQYAIDQDDCQMTPCPSIVAKRANRGLRTNLCGSNLENNMNMKIGIALVMAPILAACGDGTSFGTATPPTFAENTAESLRIFSLATVPTAAGNVPTSGTVQYSGIGSVNVDTSATDSLIANGQATVDVTFGPASTVSGQIDQFVNGSDIPVAGSIALAHSGVITGNTVAATANGTLTDNGVATTVAATGNGAFFGTNGEVLIVTLNTGTATTGGFTDNSPSVVAAVEQ